MYLPGYTSNNLALIGVTIATGFVVTIAIVMIEILRVCEQAIADGSCAEGRQTNRLHHQFLTGCR